MIPSTRSLVRATLAILAGGLALLAYAYFIEPHRLVVNHYELHIAGWDPAFDGLRVAVISDIHAGSHGVDAGRLREIVERTNEQSVDAIFLLGDFVSQKREPGPIRTRGLRMEPSELADGLSGLRARYGVFAVLGNHDEWYDAAAVIRELDRVGYNVLNGRVAEINVNDGAKLRILGLTDHTTIGIWKDYSDGVKKLLAPTEGRGDLIVLQHSPDVFPVITGDLRISGDTTILFAGHTHGGQVRIPVIGPPFVPSMFGQKFARGHARAGGIDIFTTTGIGTSILPFRFLVPPEISIVTIRPEPAK